MVDTVHNPDQYMYDFKHIVGNSKKRIGILIGAGAPVSINVGTEGNYVPLIPDIEGLTKKVKGDLTPQNNTLFGALEDDLNKQGKNKNIESVLSRARSLSEILGDAQVHEANADTYHNLEKEICTSIKECASKELPGDKNPYSDVVSWINGINRSYAVEVFTTNYDLLLEQALERVKTPFFDGFSGTNRPFFDPSTISSNDLPARWVRLWKLHGSINWYTNTNNEVTRGSVAGDGTMVYPSHIKYDQTQSAPFSALFERLKNFLLERDTILLTAGFSFADAHISAKLDECMAENPASAILAFQFNNMDEENEAVEVAQRRPNMSVYCRDGAVINGVKAPWRLGEVPGRGWETIRNEYWESDEFVLGDFVKFSRFLAKSGGGKALTKEQGEGGIEEETEDG